MFFDKLNLMFFPRGTAHNAASAEVDLGPDPGNSPHMMGIWFDGAALTTGSAITISLQTATASGGGFTTKMTWADLTVTELNAGVFLGIANNYGLDRYAKLVIANSSGGTVEAGLVMGHQSAR